MLIALGAPWLGAGAGADYAGSEACKACHAAEYAGQAASAHAHALAPARAPQPGEWAFGAGAQAITFVKRADADNYVELGQSWYRARGGYANTPGHLRGEDTRYRVFDPSAAILRCFACHSTGPLMWARDGAIMPRELGVRCEACHGPGAAHARDPAHAGISNPGRLTAEAINELCGACHRMPEAANDSVDLRNPWNARHQPLMLAASACFGQSGGRLNCETCHRPHAPLDRGLGAYDRACKACHAGAHQTSRIAMGACVECHMPTVRLGTELAFANHRIAVYASGDALTPVSARR